MSDNNGDIHVLRSPEASGVPFSSEITKKSAAVRRPYLAPQLIAPSLPHHTNKFTHTSEHYHPSVTFGPS